MKYLNFLLSRLRIGQNAEHSQGEIDPKKSVLLKNCDWFKLQQAYCTVSSKNYMKLQHIEIAAGIQELHLQTTGSCQKEGCLTYDHIIHTDYAMALIQLIDVALIDLSEASMASDKVKAEFIKAMKSIVPDSEIMGKVQVFTPAMDQLVNDTYETLSRIKTQLQK